MKMAEGVGLFLAKLGIYAEAGYRSLNTKSASLLRVSFRCPIREIAEPTETLAHILGFQGDIDPQRC